MNFAASHSAERRTSAAFAGSAAWVLVYVLVGQVGLVVTNRVASAADEAAIAIYQTHWLLLQVPYGIIGVTLLVLLALSDDGAPAHDHAVAAELVAVGATVMACTPDRFPEVLATALER